MTISIRNWITLASLSSSSACSRESSGNNSRLLIFPLSMMNYTSILPLFDIYLYDFYTLVTIFLRKKLTRYYIQYYCLFWWLFNKLIRNKTRVSNQYLRFNCTRNVKVQSNKYLNNLINFTYNSFIDL